jgi:oxygen-independent coproporphyrinogen-3 oxidase
VLDRKHTPGRVTAAVNEARRAGFEHINLDLIYGAPGESADDWQASLGAVVDAGVDHVSAYALVVEEGTRMAQQVRRGDVPAPDDDTLADRYLAAEAALTAAGHTWYEVSNWSTSPEARCRHNEGYWRGDDWWGIGPGAHSHVGGVRWWNVRHPSAYAEAIADERSPAAGRELLTDDQRHAERVLLEIRTIDGLALDLLSDEGRAAAKGHVGDGLLDESAYADGRAVLTVYGRLLADAVVLDLLTEPAGN